MPREVQAELPPNEKERLLTILENYGRERWLAGWKEHVAIPENIEPDEGESRENLLRYALLRVLINQQARVEKVRELCRRLAETFGEELYYRPHLIPEIELFRVFKEVAGERGSELYRVGRLGGIKPISLFAYRFKAYEGFIRWLGGRKLFSEFHTILKQNGVQTLFKFLSDHPVLEAGWVGNDPKACRMFVDWVVFFFIELWDLRVCSLGDTLMIVDGHVGKVFCRTGLIGEVVYEKRRPFIIEASKMRAKIESLVKSYGKIPFYVDNGAFYIFEDGFCLEENPNCGSCPVEKICMKYTKWTAYRESKGQL